MSSRLRRLVVAVFAATLAWIPVSRADALPSSGRWTAAAPMHHKRKNHTATVLPDGRVLVVGGLGGSFGHRNGTARTAELFDPATGTWLELPPLHHGRYDHTATVLEDGTVFRGRSVAADGVAFGEAVFTTGMTGYQETVTDPSYAGQLVCFTTAMVGNYGVSEERGEAAAPHAKAALMRSLGGREWAGYLREHGLIGLEGLDTRSLSD